MMFGRGTAAMIGASSRGDGGAARSRDGRGLPRVRAMNNDRRDRAIRSLNEKIRGLRIAMLTTVEPDGSMLSRPMVAQQLEFDGDLWFLARAHSHTVWSVQRHARVNLAYTDPRGDRFVSVSGRAQVVRDRSKAEQLWDPSYQTWLNGVDDPELCLVKVTVESAQVWEGPSAHVERIEGFADKT
jgi:general stress protein 26